jgi:hypothetical protein
VGANLGAELPPPNFQLLPAVGARRDNLAQLNNLKLKIQTRQQEILATRSLYEKLAGRTLPDCHPFNGRPSF